MRCRASLAVDDKMTRASHETLSAASLPASRQGNWPACVCESRSSVANETLETLIGRFGRRPVKDNARRDLEGGPEPRLELKNKTHASEAGK